MNSNDLPSNDVGGEVASTINSVREEIDTAIEDLTNAYDAKSVEDFRCEVASAIISLEQAVRDLKEFTRRDKSR